MLDEDLGAGCGTANQGNDTLLGYDADGQLTLVDPPGPHRTQTYTYDALSRDETMTDGRGVRVAYTYDAQDRVTSQTFEDDPTDAITPPTGSATATVVFEHDLDGNLTEIDDPTGQTTFDFDELNRMVKQSALAPSGNKDFGYDPADNLTSVTVSGEPEPTTYTYDPVNLVTSVNDQRAGGAEVTFAYDRRDNRTKTTYPMPDGNDVVQEAKCSRINYMDVIRVGACSSSRRGSRAGTEAARPFAGR